MKLHFTCLILSINEVLSSSFSAIKCTYRFDKSLAVKPSLLSDQTKYREQRKGCIIALKWQKDKTNSANFENLGIMRDYKYSPNI